MKAFVTFARGQPNLEVVKIMIGGKSVAKLFCMFSAVAALALLGFTPRPRLAAQSTNSGAVYVLSNQTENAVIVFHRNAHGALEPGGSFPTGGAGLGSGSNPLGSQGSLTLSADNRLLFAVNAGSDSITAFTVAGDALTPLQTISSGGTQPVSLTVHRDLLYVLNAGGASPNITGFRIVPEAQQSRTLVPIVGSTQGLPNGSAATPAEISFSPDGRAILVTEPGANQIVSFAVSQGGQVSLVNTSSVMGSGPFGLAFSQNSVAVTANTANGAPQSGSMSSYRVSESGELAPVSPPVMDNQTASTWATVTENGRIAFTSNTMSGTISSYAVSPKTGSLSLVQPTAASLVAQDGSSLMPAGMALSNDGRYLFVRNGGNQTVSGFLIHSDGSLTPVARASGLPNTAAGIAAR
jgi:6-phosphogluconolactonase